ncbi:MAG: pilus assembly protein [Myxococcaceae bacterium]|nr:pilus assembly protein [Myxococcaceae bacterium]
MKPSRHLKRLLKNESAQALVETVIVLPVVIFFILGTIQLTLMHQARLMLEYAAFNAARTGSVWNGDKGKMRRAAAISLIATRPNWPGTDGTMFHIGSTQGWVDLVVNGLKVIAENEAVAMLTDGVSLISVDILRPTEADFNGKDEIDFDQVSNSFETRRLGQLSIRVKYFYRLIIPFANMVIWNSWWSMRCSGMGEASRFLSLLNQVMEDITGENPGLGVGRRSPFLAFDYVNYNALGDMLGQLFSDDFMSTADYFEGISAGEWLAVWLASQMGDSFYDGDRSYSIPLVTGHTIRMQSNLYKCALDDSCE